MQSERHALADRIEGLADKATPRPWRRTRGAERDEDYLTGPNGEHLRRIDAKLMEAVANDLPTILAALRSDRSALDRVEGDGGAEAMRNACIAVCEEARDEYDAAIAMIEGDPEGAVAAYGARAAAQMLTDLVRVLPTPIPNTAQPQGEGEASR